MDKAITASLCINPLVSICTVTYNRSHYLPLLQECILRQDYPRELLQWVIVDDSDDECFSFDPDPRLNVSLQHLDQKAMLGRKRNLAHDLCDGSLIVYMDDDDFYPPTRVSHAVQSLLDSDELIAGSTFLPILFLPERELGLSGPFGANHATAATFAFRKELLLQTSYRDCDGSAEERYFLKNYTIPLKQLDPDHTVVCIAHNQNTFEKRHLKHPRNATFSLLKSQNIKQVVPLVDAYEQVIENRQASQKMLVHAKSIIEIIIPSRCQPDQEQLLKRSLNSIASQTCLDSHKIRVIVCLDHHADIPKLPDGLGFDVLTVHSSNSGQVAALNLGISLLRGEYVAFLEDGDQWHPNFLTDALQVIKSTTRSLDDRIMVSSTQLEVDDADVVQRINDSPEPSGWLIKRKTFIDVGEFNSEYRYHMHKEWLGRAAERNIRRCHLVESTAPIKDQYLGRTRPDLSCVRLFSNQTCQLVRHQLPVPLVTCLVQPQSGMSRVAKEPDLKKNSDSELTRLKQQFGRIPW